jgi:hypothetical protein
MITPAILRLLAVALACVGIFGAGWSLGQDHIKADQADQAALIKATAAAVQLQTAEQIAAIRVVNQTVSGKVREVVRENVVYRDCLIEPALQRLLNAAREGKLEPGPEGGLMPTPGASAP